MKSKMNKLLGLLLSLCMLCSLLPVSVFAEGLDSSGLDYYSSPQQASIGGENCGTFSVKNNGDNTFTISRTGGSDGMQTVYCRTVNGSAIGGTHFTHVAQELTFAAGVTERTVTVPEFATYISYNYTESTAYSNADRTYQLEIYRVDGGATLGSTTRATRTMEKNLDYVVDRTIYSEYKTQSRLDVVQRGDHDHDHLGWEKGDEGRASAKETITISQTPGFSQTQYWKNTADAIKFRLQFDAAEDESGYQHIQVTPGAYLDTSFGPNRGVWEGSLNNAVYRAIFEHGGDAKRISYNTYYFPDTSGLNQSVANVREEYFNNGQGTDYIRLPITADQVSVGYSASGNLSDKWSTKNQYFKFMLADSKEPQLLGIAPMAGGTYKPGDSITIALVFDEIVDSQNSRAAGFSDSFTISTSYGDMTYAGGLDTNVLYFTGTVPANASETIQFESFRNTAAIRDMCVGSTKLTSGSGSCTVTVDCIVPTVTITSLGVTNGVASAKISASNYDSLSYAWSHSTDMPESGWTDCVNNTTVTTPNEAGKWYLHALGHRNNNDTSGWKYMVFDVCSITFDMNGIGAAPAAQLIAKGGKVTKPTDPTASGYIFDGWYWDEDYQYPWNFDSDMVTRSTTIYAKWTVDVPVHSWASEWSSDGTAHWHRCTVPDCDISDYSTVPESGYQTHSAPADDGDCTTPVKCGTCGYVFTAAKTHSLQYEKDNNVCLRETCANSGCSHTATATLAAPSGPRIYNGTTAYDAKVTYSDGWAGGTLAISYTKDGAPVTDTIGAGSYTASISAGTATISVTYTVEKATPAAITFPTAAGITYGQTLATSALTGGEGDGTFAWKDGTVIPSVSNGGYEVVFTPRDTDNYDYSGVTLTQTVSISVSKANPSYDIPEGLTATYGQTLANVALPSGWTWKEATTRVGNVGEQTHKATFTPNDAHNYNVVSDIDITLQVKQATAAVTLNTGNAQGVGGNRSVELTAAVIGLTGGEAPTGTVTFYNGETAISGAVTIDDGKAVFTWENVPVGEHTLKAVYGGNNNYRTADATTACNVDKDNQTAIVIAEVPAKAFGDEPFALSVTGGSGNGAIAYTITGESVVYDEATGKFTIVKAGESTITVTKAADENYNEITITITIHVAQKAPTLTTPPTAIRVRRNNLLSTSTLSNGVAVGLDGATALEGTWTWKNDREMTEVGTFKETAIFTPTDTNYAPLEVADIPVTVYRTVTRYTVTFDTQGGSRVSAETVNRNTAVSKPSEPTRKGYAFEGWFTDKDCTEEYDFSARVTNNMTLYAKWIEDKDKPTDPADPTKPGKWKNPFTDVSENDWFYDSVRYVAENGLFSGTTETTFAPNEAITRGMLMTVLWTLENQPVVNYLMTFEDVAGDAYYAEAVRWAASEQIVKGYSAEEFAPDKWMSREEIATVMNHYAIYKGIDTSANGDLAKFTDQNQIADWAKANVSWAVGYGLLNGKGNHILDPQGNTTRAETASILQRFIESNK